MKDKRVRDSKVRQGEAFRPGLISLSVSCRRLLSNTQIIAYSATPEVCLVADIRSTKRILL